MSVDPYAFRDEHEYRSIVMKVHADQGLAFDGLFAEKLPYLSTRTPRVELDTQSKILLIELDESIAFLLLVSRKLKAYLGEDGSPNRTAMTALLSSITGTVTGIRQLVSDGLIFPAFQLCRPLRDAVNTALLCLVDSDVSERFITTLDPREANRFWHEFGSRDKDLKALNKALRLHSEGTAFSFDMFEPASRTILGMMVHPSYGGGAIAMEGDLLQMFDLKPGLAFVAPGPLSHANFHVFRLLLGAFQPSVLQGWHVDELLPIADRQLVSKLRQSLFELFLFTITRLPRGQADC